MRSICARSHIIKSLYFSDPNGVRLETKAQLGDKKQKQQKSRDTRARLDAWTARKAQWRIDCVSGKASGAIMPS